MYIWYIFCFQYSLYTKKAKCMVYSIWYTLCSSCSVISLFFLFTDYLLYIINIITAQGQSGYLYIQYILFVRLFCLCLSVSVYVRYTSYSIVYTVHGSACENHPKIYTVYTFIQYILYFRAVQTVNRMLFGISRIVGIQNYKLHFHPSNKSLQYKPSYKDRNPEKVHTRQAYLQYNILI